MRLSHFSVALVLCGLPGAAALGQGIPAATAGQGIVFVADGAGDFHIPSSTLQTVVREAGLPMSVERFSWAQGGFRPLRDLVNHQNHRDQGAILAARVQAHRSANPGDRIILVGHSTGAAVVLAAAECLPAGSVDRIILLAAAVSAGYDLNAAYAASREGVDSFHSPRDGILSTAVLAFGTADRRWQPSGGWLGFRSRGDNGMLRQHRWTVSQLRTGNFGGHFGSTSIGFLREAVLPLIAGPGSQSVFTSQVGPQTVFAANPTVCESLPLVEVGVPCQGRPGLRGRIAALIRR